VRQQSETRKVLLFCSVAPFLVVENGEIYFRLKAKLLPWKVANKVLKLIREA
jgi:hypothetical protein